ncbi:MAG: hypothetical protein H6765_04035 [Candidatus Peribacteria bacterium]|nr:MAG: hypothetical protein H6765_04035 [Candidatus Peribacteria bacterium]
MKLNIVTPGLVIQKIDYQGIGAEITAELEHDLDYGQIRFEKERHGFWEALNPSTYSVVPEQVEYKG